MPRYSGYLLAVIISVWVVILGYSLRSWLKERKFIRDT